MQKALLGQGFLFLVGFKTADLASAQKKKTKSIYFLRILWYNHCSYIYQDSK
jgi:hypothetical protein